MVDELEGLLTQYDGGGLTRRQLLQGLIALGVGGTFAHPALGSSQGLGTVPVFKTRTINHVTLYSADVSRSKASARLLRCFQRGP